MDQIENPRIRPICDLLSENFFVPRYQRGYRWGKQEITELLDDILQYHRMAQDRDNRISKFYCLQPIVVKEKEWKGYENEAVNGWELIDGQQILTTILILLHYLEDIRKLMSSNTNVYSITFETRENCNLFFKNKVFKSSIDTSNVDFYHISKGYEHIKTWFDEKNHKLEVLNTLLKPDYNVSVIWYEVIGRSGLETKIDRIEENNSIDLFTRLNEGKIPLTDAELIKALLLQADFYPQNEEKLVKQRLFEIASEWDEIEATLHDEKMWLFINTTEYHPSSKIELIFKLLADKWNGSTEQRLVKFDIKQDKPKHFEYLVFDKYLVQSRDEFRNDNSPNKESLDPINKIWKEIKEIFGLLLEWYEDHALFHYIGYLMAIDYRNRDRLIKEAFSLSYNKNDFIVYIKNEIAKTILIRKKNDKSQNFKKLNEIAYGEDDNEIRRILLLFNVETLIHHQKENGRFPFHLYKKEKITSIEHIHPQNPENIDTNEDRRNTWLRTHLATLEIVKTSNDNYKDEINTLITKIKNLLEKYNDDEFKTTYSETIELYTNIADFKENELHTLYNLALVDKDTNSSLNNSFFDIKREILKDEKQQQYIPICTQRAFSKYYSASPQEMIFWSSNDREAYFKAIESVYNSFTSLLKA